MSTKIFTLSCNLVMVLLFASTTFAQSTNGYIAGTVKDVNDAVVPGATVTVINPANSITQTATSADDGGFNIPQLPPGTYNVTVEKDGFKKAEKTGVVLNAADRLNAGDFVMEVGSVGETVTVQADAGQLQIKSESGERADVISNRQIKDLALNGRNLLDLVKIVPGIVSNVNGQVSSTAGVNQFNINGTRSNQHEMTIDGSSNVDSGDNNFQHVSVNPDAVAEVKILTSNYQAEFGKAGGGFIAYVTKSGTREFHGTGRYFRRHDSLNANDFFRNAQSRNPDGSESQPRTLYRYNYYGYDIGGPVYIPFLNFNRSKDKAFFFFNQEFYKQLVPSETRNIRVPTLAERNGDFSQTVDGTGRQIFISDSTRVGANGARLPCTAANTVANPGGCFVSGERLHVIPRERFFGDGPAILNIYPQPNLAGVNQFNYTSAVSNQYPRREDILRIDYQFTERTRLTARYINNVDEPLQPYGTPTSTFNFPLTQIAFRRPSRNAALTLFHIFNPTLTNEFIFGPSNNRQIQFDVDGRALRTNNNITFPLLFPNTNPDGYIPTFTYGTIASQTLPSATLQNLPLAASNTLFNFVDNVTKTFAKHAVKAGIFIQRSRRDQTAVSSANGNISFANDVNNPLNTGHPFANALLGIYQSYQQARNQSTIYLRYTNAEFYGQDTWRVNPRLTLDYGMRFSYYQPAFDDRLQLSPFNANLFNPARAVRLYEPVLVGTTRRAVDPNTLPATLTTSNTLPANLVGLIVPNSGDLLNGIGLASEGYPKGGYDGRGLQLGPRLGFAYKLTEDNKTVVRGGFGVNYDRIGGNLQNQLVFNNPPTTTTSRLTFGNLQELGSGTDFPLGTPDIVGVPTDGHVPTVYNFSLGVQRDIGFGTVIDIAYVGTQSRHLQQVRNINSIPYGTTFLREAQDPTLFAGGIVPAVEPNLPAAYSQAGLNFSGAFAKRIEFLRPIQGYGNIQYREFVGSSNYNSLQVSVNRRVSQSFTFGLAYTFSKTFDTADRDITAGGHPFNTRLYDYKLADFDRTHVFVLNYVYNLPKISRYFGSFGENRVARAIFDNYQITGITQFISGTPFELGFGVQGINAGQRITGSYSEGPRFTLRDDPQRNSTGLLISPDAFVIPPIGSVGLGPRRYLRNPGVNNHDISIFKNFPFGGEGSRYLQLRLEMFNAFNHTQFAGINSATQLTTPTGAIGNAIFASYDQLRITNNLRPQGSTEPLGRFFGEYNEARDPRIIQLGVKLYF